jgi:PadR family transcriptional regulator PadR
VNVAFARDLLRGSLDLMVLSDLNRGSRYGYQILGSLRARSAGRVDLKAGTLYPILHKLERDGCVRSWWDDSTGRDRKWYALTDKGRRRLEADARQWLDYAACVRAFLRPVVDALNGGVEQPAAEGEPA